MVMQSYDLASLDLDAEKKEAIRTIDGPLLIIAGPGSGKTRTLVERVVYLSSCGVAPERIMVATFTEKAAKELVTRISNRMLELEMQVNLNEMYIGTLHSIFLRMLEEHREHTRLRRNYRMLDAFDQKYFVFDHVWEFMEVEDAELVLGVGGTGSNWLKAEGVVAEVNRVAEESLDVAELLTAADPRIAAIGRITELYRALLDEENAIDFSTIQVETLAMLRSDNGVLGLIQDQISHIMVDEYQDTNTIQEEILLLLAGRSHNLCVVGDDDQSLYRFRGASVRNILEFPENFGAGECRMVRLTVNYRSHPGIIDFYNGWMERLDWTEEGKRFRYDKRIVPQSKEFGNYPSVVRVSAPGSALNYHEEVLGFLRDLEDKGCLEDYNQVAFLFKSVKNERVIALADYLEGHGIPVFSPRSALFFRREEVRLLLGALVFIFPDLFEQLKWRDDAKLDVWTYYEGCKDAFAEAVRSDRVLHQGLLTWAQGKAKAHLSLDRKTTYGFAALVYQLLEYPMFSRYLDGDLGGRKTDMRAAYNVAQLTKLLYKFEYLHNLTVLGSDNLQRMLQALFNRFLRFLIDGGIVEYEDFEETAPAGCVSFMTIHQSKGLEFPVVLVGELGAVPRKSYDEVDEVLQRDFYHKPPFEPLERIKEFDFWRLYYTAFSRPQNILALTCNEHLGAGRKTPSKYFMPMYRDLPHWRDDGFDASVIRLDSIRATHIKHEYSFTSHVLLYENCPSQYKFYKELEFTEVRTGGVVGGTLLHQTIEDIHRAVLRGEPHLVTNENIRDWFNANYQLLVKRERNHIQEAQREALLRQVIRYKDKQQGNWDKIKAAEIDVSLVKPGYILKGTIDLMEGKDGTVELVDFKSGDKPDVNATDALTRATLARYRRQLEVYAHLVEERYGLKVSKMHLYYPKEEAGSPYLSFDYVPERVAATIASFEQVVEKIERKDFDSSQVVKSERQCGGCDMRFYCNPRVYSK